MSELENRMNTNSMITRAMSRSEEIREVSNNGSIDEKLSTILDAIAKSGEDFVTLTQSVKSTDTAVTNLTAEMGQIRINANEVKDVKSSMEGLKEQLYATQGKVSRLEQRQVHLEEKLIEYETREYEHDLMFYNVQDNYRENPQTLKTKLYNILTDNMKIPVRHIYSNDNPTGEIRLDTVKRYGTYSERKDRPIVVSFVTKSGRNLAYSRAFTANLKDPIRIRVAEHFPPIIKERRQAQIKKLVDLREEYEGREIKVTLSKDKIFVDGKLQETEAFGRNPLNHQTPLSIHYDKLDHSDPETVKKSTFQAHALLVSNKDQATAAKNAIYQHPTLALATHQIYAYKIGNNIGSMIESGYADDGEIQGGKVLMELLDELNLTDVFICVTREKGGGNIGPDRFKLIEKTAKQLLERQFRELDENPIFNKLVMEEPDRPIINIREISNNPLPNHQPEEVNPEANQSEHSSY